MAPTQVQRPLITPTILLSPLKQLGVRSLIFLCVSSGLFTSGRRARSEAEQVKEDRMSVPIETHRKIRERTPDLDWGREKNGWSDRD